MARSIFSMRCCVVESTKDSTALILSFISGCTDNRYQSATISTTRSEDLHFPNLISSYFSSLELPFNTSTLILQFLEPIMTLEVTSLSTGHIVVTSSTSGVEPFPQSSARGCPGGPPPRPRRGYSEKPLPNHLVCNISFCS